MKRIFLNTLFFVFCTLLFVSCEKTSEETGGYSSFYLSMPTFSSSNGEKTHWDSQGLWWDNSGDVVRINGFKHQIRYRDGNWMTTSTTDTTFAESDGNYYICYMGTADQQAVRFNHDNKTYTDVDLTGIVPLVGVGRTNFITLHPCCAVLKINNLGDISQVTSVTFTMSPTSKKFYKRGTVNPTTATVTSTVPSDKINQFANIRVDNGTAYFILPMDADSYNVTKITIKANNITRYTSTNSLVLRKGVVYTVDWQAIQPAN